jgi:hypothetical protein
LLVFSLFIIMNANDVQVNGLFGRGVWDDDRISDLNVDHVCTLLVKNLLCVL